MFTSCVNSKIILSNRDDLKQPPCSLLKSGEGTKTNISICTNWQSGCVSNIDGKSWYLFSSIFFDFQTLELISQSLQPSQNRAKDPRGTSEHGTSILGRWPCNVYLSSRVSKVALHINPTCGVEAELGIQIPTETVLEWTYWKFRTAQRATFHS